MYSIYLMLPRCCSRPFALAQAIAKRCLDEHKLGQVSLTWRQGPPLAMKLMLLFLEHFFMHGILEDREKGRQRVLIARGQEGLQEANQVHVTFNKVKVVAPRDSNSKAALEIRRRGSSMRRCLRRTRRSWTPTCASNVTFLRQLMNKGKYEDIRRSILPEFGVFTL